MNSSPKPENPFYSIVFNIVIPSLVLNKLSSHDKLGPVYGMLVAIAFPLAYSIWDYYKRRSINFVSILGFVSVLLTGVFALVQLPVDWIAVKEAAVPAVIAAVILGSMATQNPLVKKFLYSDTIVNIDLIESRLATPALKAGRDLLLQRSSYFLAGSFLVSSALNFILARVILKSATGTPEFNAELGKMQALSWPVIVLPSMICMGIALWYLMRGLKNLTGLEMDQILKGQGK